MLAKDVDLLMVLTIWDQHLPTIKLKSHNITKWSKIIIPSHHLHLLNHPLQICLWQIMHKIILLYLFMEIINTIHNNHTQFRPFNKFNNHIFQCNQCILQIPLQSHIIWDHPLYTDQLSKVIKLCLFE